MKGRQEAVSRGKALLIHAGVEYLGRSTREMAQLTKISGPSASRARLRGRMLWEKNGLEKTLRQERP